MLDTLRTFVRRLLGRTEAPGPSTTTFAGESRIVRITTPHAGAAAPVARQQQFIADHWAGLASAAHLGFQRHGIGVVVVQPRPARSDAVQALEAYQLRYATGYGPWMDRALDRRARHWVNNQLQQYDPQADCLLMFEDDGRSLVYRATGTLPPAQASRGARASLN